MACCILTAYIMNRIIKACEVLDLHIIRIQYNDFDDGPTCGTPDARNEKERSLVATKLSVDGMTCAACTSTIKSALTALPGVQRVALSLPLSRATIIHNPAVAAVAEIVSTIEKAGYNAQAYERSPEQNLEVAQHSTELKRLKNGFSNAAILASVIAVLDWLSQTALFSRSHLALRSTSAILGIWIELVEASWIHQQAWGNGLRSQLNMNTLISLSLIFGFSLSCLNVLLHGIEAAQQYFLSGSFLTVVVIGGRYLDTLFRRQTSASLAELYRLQSATGMVSLRKTNLAGLVEATNSKERVPAILLQPRDEIIIDAGAIIPCDCYVIEGTSVVDQSTMTGEWLPVTKTAGDVLMSGTRNLSNELVAVVVREQLGSALEQLVSSISSTTEKSSSDGPSEVVSSHFVLGILSLAMIGFGWTFATCEQQSPFLERLNLACGRGMAILASACPCALGLATPSAIMTGVSVAWAKGAILTGGFSAIQRLEKLTHVVMDKTGTLTTGRLMVTDVQGRLEENDLVVLCAAEQQDALTHPVARAVFQWALRQLNQTKRREQNALQIQDLSSEPGKGVTCKVMPSLCHEWTPVHVGNSTFLTQHDVSLATFPASSPKDKATATEVQIAISHRHVSTLRLRDTIRPEAPSVINSLRSRFGLNLTLLTGDNEHEADRISRGLDVPVLASRCLPHEKKALVEQLQSQDTHNVVAMLGDGLNDTPAMAAADVAIFLSPGLLSPHSSLPYHKNPTGLQRQTADVIITTPSLGVLPELLLIAQKTMRQAKWNTRWAIVYNVIAVTLAMGVGESWGVKVDAAMAGTMMALSSTCVMLGCGFLRWELQRVDLGHKG
jgi:P-type Cu+ transporter